ncbi:pyridoxal-phosphate dependent enzyme [Kutzneria buriramensis]|uniref:Diaminopropionate ammonia-lyase n=1 Tax=Kutzneria buriramensis TaxID=1045776 RepID=A0A3E0HQC7_9PSEU|nr:pyridoxal-phosphate dependent enzyme [Kutzneria buriramensis]REH48205.1 diaminopropionate ammonia-lyase [Kutzneria buriramensis]
MTLYRRPEARHWRCEPAPEQASAFHRKLPGYAPTPLVDVPKLAVELGVGQVLVKDESARLGLPAFKVLGASWGIRQALTGFDPDGPDTLDGLRELVAGRGIRLVTATDGNHGRAVAHFGRLIGVSSTVFVPSAVGEVAVDAIRGEGAELVRVDGSYDDACRAADAAGGILLQDTAWDGYERIPAAIVDGYSTLFREITVPASLVVVPMGVGSLAHAAVRHYRSTPGAVSLLGVEPLNAPCVLSSLDAGRVVSLETTDTVMTALNCGTPSSTALPALLAGLDSAVAVRDEDTRQALQDLRDLGVNAGPAGAATLAGVRAARSELDLPPDGRIVLVSTEGRHS